MGGMVERCLLQMQSGALSNDMTEKATSSMQEASSLAEGGAEGLGAFVGDLMVTIDAFFVVCACAFVIGFVFLILLAFIVRPLVYISILVVLVLFLAAGGSAYAQSGRCEGESLTSTATSAGVAASNTAQTLGEAAVDQALQGQNANFTALASTFANEDMSGRGGDYAGAQTRTRSGKLCQRWDSQTPWAHSYVPPGTTDTWSGTLVNNYCRNPEEVAPTIWCYTTDTTQRWELCTPLGVILKDCPNGYEVDNETAREILKIIAYILWIIAGLWIIAVGCFFSRINLAIKINQWAAKFVVQTPTIIFVPIVQAILCIIWAIVWFYSAAFLISQVPEGYVPTDAYASYNEAFGTDDDPGKCTDKWPTGGVWKDEANCDVSGAVVKCWKCYPPRYFVGHGKFVISFFQYLWQNALLIAIGQCVIAMATGLWFFNQNGSSGDVDTEKHGKKGGLVVKRAVGTIFRYHIGSLAFGAFILALVQLIRYILKYFENQAKAQKNKIMVLVLKVLQCCMWCFEQCIKFLNKNAYIQIALMGTNFCASAKNAFYLILRNFIRFGVVAMLGGVIKWLGMSAITVATVVLGYYIFVAMHPDSSPVIPVCMYLFVGYVIAKLYITVFQLAVDTILQCFIIVEESGSGSEKQDPELKKLIDDNPSHHKPAEDNKGAAGEY